MAKVKKPLPRMTPELMLHFKILKNLVDQNKTKEALEYLSNLPRNIYDDIIERSSKNGKFRSIFTKLENTAEKHVFKSDETRTVRDLETIIF